MLTYVFTARNADTGDEVKAEVQAENEQAAARLLIERNLFPISITEKGQAKGIFGKKLSNRIKSKDRIVFTRQLATLVTAGLPILQSLRSVHDQISNSAMRDVVHSVITEVEGGSALSAAFAKHPKVFNETYISLVAAGEASGSLDKTLDRLAYQMEKDAQVYSKVRGAMVYPAIVLAVIVIVMVFLLTVVLPQIGQIYSDFDRELPFVTSLLLSVSEAISSLWWLFLIAIAGGVYALRRYIQTPHGRLAWDRFKLSLPMFGRLFQKVYMARFSRGMATLLSSGVPILNALDIVKNTINNRVISDTLVAGMADVRSGKALSATLYDNQYFMRVVPQMVKIGEDSGAIGDVLDRLASYFEQEIDETVKTLSTAVEPVLMIIMGLTVGTIMAAVLLPIYGLVSLGLQ